MGRGSEPRWLAWNHPQAGPESALVTSVAFVLTVDEVSFLPNLSNFIPIVPSILVIAERQSNALLARC